MRGPRLRFNKVHKKARYIIERPFGVLKKRLCALKTGMSVRNMKREAELVRACLYCSLCILFSDNGDELLLLRRNMSSSVDSLSAVNDFPLALEASSFLADGRASRLVFVGVGVCPTACLGSRQRYVDVHLLFDHFQFQR